MKFLHKLIFFLMLLSAPAWSQFITVPLAVSAPGGATAVVTWTTCAASSTQLNYGTTVALGSSSTFDPTLVTSHSVSLSGLTPGTLYFLQVVSSDTNGVQTVWPMQMVTKIVVPVSLALNPPSATVVAGGTRQFKALLTNSDTSITDVTTQAKWTTSDGTKATVGATTGLATGVAAGSANITATLSQPAFVQINSGQSPSAASLAVAYPLVQVLHNTNVVIVGWNAATGTVSGVADTVGNTYLSAVGPIRGTALSLQIFTAKNIGAGQNTVTVTFSGAQPFIDIQVEEYAGIDITTPVDVAAGAAGTSVTANSGTLTTTNANDILVAGGITLGRYNGPGPSFVQRTITPFGDLVQDSLLNLTGVYSAQADQAGSTNWVFDAVALKGNAGSTATAALTVNAALANYSLFTTQTPASTTPAGAQSSSEMGVLFTTDIPGTVTGVKMYRATQQTGQNVGSVWDVATGTKLGTGNFPATGSGWQTAPISPAITLQANKLYMVSYKANGGFFFVDQNYYNVGRNIGPLHAPIGAGVYTYTLSPTTLPNLNFLNSNFWADLVFSSATPPAVAHSVDVNWTVASGTNTYTVYRQTGGCGGVFVAIKSGIAGVTYNDPTVISGQTYCYAATSTNANGTSGFSNSATAVIPTP
jgi:hypothetical protein